MTRKIKPVKFLVSGWNVLEDGSYHPFKVITDYEHTQTYLHLATQRNTNVIIKVDNIEVIWNAD